MEDYDVFGRLKTARGNTRRAKLLATTWLWHGDVWLEKVNSSDKQEPSKLKIFKTSHLPCDAETEATFRTKRLSMYLVTAEPEVIGRFQTLMLMGVTNRCFGVCFVKKLLKDVCALGPLVPGIACEQS